MTATEITLEGQLQSEGFPDWICHRARLLDLRGWVSRQDGTRMTIVVVGPEPLVGAMEMACSLGPVDIRVDRIVSNPLQLKRKLNGFYKR